MATIGRGAIVGAVLALALASVAASPADAPRDLIVVDGDSIAAGTGLPAGQAWPSGLAIMRPAWDVVNVAVGGKKCFELAATAATRVDPLYRTDRINLMAIWCGTNDLAWGYTPSATFNALRGYAAARRAAGWKVVAITTLPRPAGAYLPIPEAARAEYNGLIRSTWPAWADGLVDLDTDLRIGAAGAPSNPLYYASDLIHPTVVGHAVVAGHVDAVLARLAPSPLPTFAATAMPASGTATPTIGDTMTTLTIQPDGTAGADAFIRSDQATTNFGTNTAIAVGNVSGLGTFRTLIKFDLSGLPSDAVISSAVLSIYAITDNALNSSTVRVYRQKRAWVESQATWNIYSTGNAWGAAGGFNASDCEQTDIGSVSLGANEALSAFKDIPLTPTTKAGLDLGNGWLIKADTEIGDEYNYASSDHATAANRPKLVIVYTLPPPGGDAPIQRAFPQPFRGAF